MSSDSELIKQCINLINNKESNALVNFLQNFSNPDYNIIFNPIDNIYETAIKSNNFDIFNILIDFHYYYSNYIKNNDFINLEQLKCLLIKGYKLSNKFICLISKRNEATAFLRFIYQYYTFNENLILSFLINCYQNKIPLSHLDLNNIVKNKKRNKNLNDILDIHKSIELDYKRSWEIYGSRKMYVRYNPLSIACKYECIDVIKFLIEHGVDANIDKGLNFDRIEIFPLNIAIKKGNESIVKYLVEHGANVNAKYPVKECGDEGCCYSYATPLIIAIQYYYEAIVKYLIEHGANVNYSDTSVSCCSDFEDYSVLSIAKDIGYTPIIEYLIEHGAIDNNDGE